jgi:hypothetical protein
MEREYLKRPAALIGANVAVSWLLASIALRTPASVVLLLLSAGACGHPNAPDQVPAWLTSVIRELEAQPVANPPAFIARYEYEREVVYYLPARCCDIWSNLYRVDGTIRCHPDGGLTGHGDGRCPDFSTARTNEQIIWRDPR